MSKLDNIKSANSLKDFAKLLGYKPKALAYILYKIPSEQKYTEFTILKKTGGERRILAPHPKLKKLQKTLANYLYECCDEIQISSGQKNKLGARNKKAISHGFQKDLSIATNAGRHLGRRYVFNVDIENFFPSFNFGRVRGFFIKNTSFNLCPDVATIIAQIACHNNELPQGSPCSPVISNMLGQILDLRLAKLAKKHGCRYTRYADDLTFSSNIKDFPQEIGFNSENGDWVAGKKLEGEINAAGFSLNKSKTRMQYKTSRQVVTGLVVNKAVNVKAEKYRYARAMCHALFKTGSFDFPEQVFAKKNNDKQQNLLRLKGILSHIYYVKSYRNKHAVKGYRESSVNTKYPPKDRCNQYSDVSHVKAVDGIKNLYKSFLCYTHFHALEQPLILCEGKTDRVYLTLALKKLAASYPALVKANNGTLNLKLSFLNRTTQFSDITGINPGTSGMHYLLTRYSSMMTQYRHDARKHPVILLYDNDDGFKETQSYLKKNLASYEDEKNFYHVCYNIYVAVLPKLNNQPTKIEDYFEESILKKEIGGKVLNAGNSPIGDKQEISKTYFASHIQQKQDEISFEKFKAVLNILNDIIFDYRTRQIQLKKPPSSNDQQMTL